MYGTSEQHSAGLIAAGTDPGSSPVGGKFFPPFFLDFFLNAYVGDTGGWISMHMFATILYAH